MNFEESEKKVFGYYFLSRTSQPQIAMEFFCLSSPSPIYDRYHK